MELRREPGGFRNGFDDFVELDETHVYPMLKSSDVANGETERPSRWMLVTQRSVGEDTAAIKRSAPATWAYLCHHAGHLDRRSSSIYRGRPRFSVFGVGPYTFSPWKVAISGFYKRLGFAKVGPFEGKPVVFDDTSYFLPCSSRKEADLLCALLNSDTASEFYSSLIFWDAKRPITVGVLSQLNIPALADESGEGTTLRALRRTPDYGSRGRDRRQRQLLLD
jgi:hypothetical protein